MGDLFFNGMYPYIDPGADGKITGMTAAVDKILSPLVAFRRLIDEFGELRADPFRQSGHAWMTR